MSIICRLYVTIRIIHKRYYSTQIALQFDTAYLRSTLHIVMQKSVTFDTYRIVWQFVRERWMEKCFVSGRVTVLGTGLTALNYYYYYYYYYYD